MISNRTLAVAAILALALPAVGAAAPIVQPPQPETLVEGHTVFTVITQYSNVGPLPLPDIDINVSLDIDVFSNLTADLCIKVSEPIFGGAFPEVNGTVTDEEQVNASGTVTGTPAPGTVPVPTQSVGTGPVPTPGDQPLPPRDETCTRPRRPNTTLVTEEFAAAVAVLVREYNPNQEDKLFINATADLNANVNETINSDSDLCTDLIINPFPCVRRGNNGRWSRFPGVLWFNDQYLINPTSGVGRNDADGSPLDLGAGPIGPQTGDTNTNQNACIDVAYQRNPPQVDVPCDYSDNGGNYFRYPCGGSVLAVRSGMPDPREVMVNAKASGTNTSVPGSSGHSSEDFSWIGLNDTRTDPIHVTGGVDAENYTNDNSQDAADLVGGTQDPIDYALGDNHLDPSGGFVGQGFGGSTNYLDYVESYLITDPNDHSWVIDLYQARTQTFLTSGDQTRQTFYIWAVNTLGTPVFVPDEGQLNCMPFEDLLSSVKVDADGDGVNEVDGDAANAAIESTPCDQPVDDPVFGGFDSADSGNATPAPRNVNNGYLAAKDDPCAGYKEPSDGATAYCYGGQAQGTGTCANRDDPFAPNYTPLRLYNALLYFQSEHLGALSGTRTHGTSTSDTNGCQTGTEWACPGSTCATNPSTGRWECTGGDDNAEGNSHPFHPDTTTGHDEGQIVPGSTRGDIQDCPRRDLNGDGDFTDDGEEGFTDNANGNHGGSATPTVSDNVAANECDFTHALWDVDIYFSAFGRPLEPVVRNFDVIDTQGSDAPFSQTEQPDHPGPGSDP